MDENTNQAYLLRLIKTKIPSEIMEQLELSKGLDEWTFELLRSRLKLHLYAKEESIRHTSPLIQLGAQPDTSIRPKSLDSFITPRSNTTKGNRFTSETLSNSSYSYNSRPGMSCAYCGASHFSDECRRYPTIDARKARMNRSCLICLRANHSTQNCNRNQICVYCHLKKAHHRSLCPNHFPLRNEAKTSETMTFINENKEEIIDP